MIQIKAFALTLGLICASFTVQAQEAKQPEWVNNPYSVCDEDSFCAVGIAKSMKTATADARAGIAKIFQAKVKSSFSSSVSSDNDTVSSEAKSKLSEESDVLLKSVEIKETFMQGDTVYALASLNKPRAGRIIAAEIDDIDSKMESYIADDDAASARKAEKLYEKRRELNELMIVLTGKDVMENFSYNDVFKNRKEKTKTGDICLKFSGIQTESFKRTVKNVFQDNGHIVSNECSATITVDVSVEEEPFDVEGLHKYAFTFLLKAKDARNGKQTMLFETTLTEAGINEKKTLPFITDQFKQELTDAIGDFSF